jgi:immune inhibitor A
VISKVARYYSLVALLALLLALVPSAYAAPPSRPQLMPPHPRLWPDIQAGKIIPGDRVFGMPGNAGAQAVAAPHPRLGQLKALAVLVQFSDKAHTVSASFFDSLIFGAEVSGRGSVNDYFNEISYSQVDIVAVTLPSAIGWKTAPHPLSYYVSGGENGTGTYPNNCQKLAEDVVDAINGVVDFSQYDNDGDGYTEPIMLIHAGGGAEYTGLSGDIWSHSWSLQSPRSVDGVTVRDYVIMPEYFDTVNASSSDMSVGVFAHEMGHGFWGLPDLYDRDYSSEGVGNWSLMAGGSWNGPTGKGDSPAWPDAWSRVQMGFVAPTNVSANALGRSIPQVYGASGAGTVLKVRYPGLASQEYFLLENREKASGTYDEYLPGGGLFIWHVDEAMGGYALQNDYECSQARHCDCSDTQHYLVALEEADNQHKLEFNPAHGGNRGDAGDPYPGTANNRSFSASTQPENSSWYSCSANEMSITNISNAGVNMTADIRLTALNLPVRGYIPLVRKSVVETPPPPGWTTIMSDGFEGGLSGSWFRKDYWGASNCQAFGGSLSAWPLGAMSLSCGANYPDNIDSYMMYGPFSLEGATAADLSFKLWVQTELNWDYLCRLASTSPDPASFVGTCTSGNSSGWIDKTLDLSNAEGTNFLGQPSVYIALEFLSDGSNNYPGGAFVDNVVLRKCTGGSCTTTSIAPSEWNNGGRLSNVPAGKMPHK